MSTTVFYGYIGDDAEKVYKSIFGDDNIKETKTTYKTYDVSFHHIVTGWNEGYWICYINDMFESMMARYGNALTSTLKMPSETYTIDDEFNTLVYIPPEIHIISIHSDDM